MAQTITFVDEDGRSLLNIAYIDNMLTVIDGNNFWNLYNQEELENEKPLAGLLVEQLEFCNTVAINKSTNPELENFVQKLNHTAKIVATNWGKIELNQVLFTNTFDLETAETSAGWIKELQSEHIAETKEFGISSFVYRAKKPINAQKFEQVILHLQGVLRAKGFYWTAQEEEYIKEFALVGNDVQMGQNVAFVPSEHFDKRTQEFVFIGQNMNKAQITQDLDNCLEN